MPISETERKTILGITQVAKRERVIDHETGLWVYTLPKHVNSVDSSDKATLALIIEKLSEGYADKNSNPASSDSVPSRDKPIVRNVLNTALNPPRKI
jgi:hypothetical protein